MKVQFINTTYDCQENVRYKAGLIADVSDEFASNCIKLGAAREIIENVSSHAIETVKEELKAAKEELIAKAEVEEAIEEALIANEQKALDLTKMTVKELKDFAKDNSISLKSKSKKDDIIKAIEEALEVEA